MLGKCACVRNGAGPSAGPSGREMGCRPPWKGCSENDLTPSFGAQETSPSPGVWCLGFSVPRCMGCSGEDSDPMGSVALDIQPQFPYLCVGGRITDLLGRLLGLNQEIYIFIVYFSFPNESELPRQGIQPARGLSLSHLDIGKAGMASCGPSATYRHARASVPVSQGNPPRESVFLQECPAGYECLSVGGGG